MTKNTLTSFITDVNKAIAEDVETSAAIAKIAATEEPLDNGPSEEIAAFTAQLADPAFLASEAARIADTPEDIQLIRAPKTHLA